MKATSTICSRQKDERLGLLPARLRYTAPHVLETEKIATEQGLPFFILSGKYGLIPADTEIPCYDYYLEASAADPLAGVIKEQLLAAGITELDFYTEAKPSWAPYEQAITKGAASAGITLHILPLVS